MRITGRSPIAFLLLFASCTTSTEQTSPEWGPITEAVYASGVVKAADQYNAFASTSGILLDALVEEGDTVKAGQPLFLIDDRAAALGQRKAELALELVSRNAEDGSPLLRELELSADLARTRLVNDSLLFTRQQALWAQRIGSQAEFEQRELAYQASRTAHANALAALEDTRQRLRNELGVARIEQARSQVSAGDLTVRSLADARVYDVMIEEGELVTPQKPLAVLGSAERFIIELQVDQQDIARVREGQRVLLTMDSHQGRAIEAVVTRVLPILDQRSRTFTVEAGFTEQPERLAPYLTAEANIIVQHKPRALTIPTEYLIDGRYVLTDGGDTAAVTAGLHDLQRTEILSGLDSTMQLTKP